MPRQAESRVECLKFAVDSDKNAVNSGRFGSGRSLWSQETYVFRLEVEVYMVFFFYLSFTFYILLCYNLINNYCLYPMLYKVKIREIFCWLIRLINVKNIIKLFYTMY